MKKEPDAHELVEIHGRTFHNLKPKCHPRANETALQLGSRPLVGVASHTPHKSDNERVSGFDIL